jgi:hypothetical protein
VKLLALAFIGLLCATLIGFVSGIRPLKRDLPDFGYDESLGIESSSLSSVNFRLNCSNGRAMALQAGASPVASFASRQ